MDRLCYRAIRALYTQGADARGYEAASGREIQITLCEDPGRGDYYLLDPTTGDRIVIEYEGETVKYGKSRVDWEEFKG